MLEHSQTREAMAADQNRRRMLFALVLLLIAITVTLVKNRAYWFGEDEVAAADDSSASQPVSPPPPMPVLVAQPAPSVSSPDPVTRREKSVTTAAQPVPESPSVVVNRSALPPLQVELVVDGKHRAVQPDSRPLKVDVPSDAPITSAASQLSPVVNTVQRTPLSSDQAKPPYPLLASQTNVQGAVLLQALIAADGRIRDLHVISGPLILSSAARVAALQWRFRPYLQNGKAVETEARITVNFVIKVSDDKARDPQDAHKHNFLPSSPSPNPGN